VLNGCELSVMFIGASGNGSSAMMAAMSMKDRRGVASRREEIRGKPFDEYNGEFTPTFHPVSPRLFTEVQKLLSIADLYDCARPAYDVGEAITRGRLSSYRVGDAQVFCGI
jgi:hypothetical protein